RLLEALFRLAAAEDITGIARGVAFQLTEALGVLDRHKVADEVKGLGQPARATLRKYGVRFGAYHIYLPALLKPAPRVLATQLWALKHGGSERKGLEAIEQLAASGRTSIAADQEIAKVLYRTAGYRVCGARAVRVDILERLADLIRPALAWRAGAAGAKPPGAIEGFGFTVTVGMTSLVGCSGEDFASVLRSLGYRMEKRPKPAELPPAPVESTPPAARSAQATPVQAPSTDDAVAPAPAVDGEPRREPSVEMTQAATADAPAVEDAVVEATASAPNETVERANAPVLADAAELGASVAQAPPLAVSAQAEGVAQDVGMSQPPPEVAPKTEFAAEEFIEVWRPVRRDEHARKPRHERGPRQRRPQRQPGAQLVAATLVGTAAASADSEAPPAAGTAEASPASHAPPRGPPRRTATRERERRGGGARGAPRASSARSPPAASGATAARRGAAAARRARRAGAARRSPGSRSGAAREIHQGPRRGERPPRSRARPEFTVRQACCAQGA